MLGLQLSQILTQMLAFLIMLWVMKKFAWKPILAILDERKAKIAQEFDDIHSQKNKIEQLSKEYQQKLSEIETLARDKVKEGIDEGLKIANSIEDDARQEAKIILEKAKANVTKEIAKAKIQLKSDIVNLTIAATKKLIHENFDSEKQKKLIDEEIARQWHEPH